MIDKILELIILITNNFIILNKIDKITEQNNISSRLNDINL